MTGRRRPRAPRAGVHPITDRESTARRLRAEGLSYRSVAAKMRISAGRVQQLLGYAALKALEHEETT